MPFYTPYPTADDVEKVFVFYASAKQWPLIQAGEKTKQNGELFGPPPRTMKN